MGPRDLRSRRTQRRARTSRRILLSIKHLVKINLPIASGQGTLSVMEVLFITRLKCAMARTFRSMAGSLKHLLRYGSERDTRSLMQDFLRRPVSPQAFLEQIHRLKQVSTQATGDH